MRVRGIRIDVMSVDVHCVGVEYGFICASCPALVCAVKFAMEEKTVALFVSIMCSMMG